MIRRLLLIAALMAVAPSAFAQTTYWVTEAGAGTADGTSLANAWSMASYNASSAPGANDTVCFSGTISSQVQPNNTSGTSGNLLTLDFSGSGTCAAATEATLDIAAYRILLTGEDYIDLIGGIMGDLAVSGAYMISLSSQISVGLTISDWTYDGTDANSPHFLELKACQSCTVEDNVIYGTARSVWSDTSNTHDVTIRNNDFETGTNTVLQSDIISLADAYNVVIEGNRLYMQAPGNVSVRHNDIIQMFQSGATPNAPPTNWTIRYNWLENANSTGSGDTGYCICENPGGDPGIKFYGNVLFGPDVGDDSNNGIAFFNAQSDFVGYVYHNTFIRKNNPDNTIRFLGANGTIHARNNVGFADLDETGTFLDWTMTEGSDWNYNFFYQFDDCTATESGANGSCATDPLFTDYAGDDFSLNSATSTLIGEADETIGAEYGTGIAYGATWPNPATVTRDDWDPGAFEFIAGGGGGGIPAPSRIWVRE